MAAEAGVTSTVFDDEPSSGVRHTSLPATGPVSTTHTGTRSLLLDEREAEADTWHGARYVELTMDGQALYASEGSQSWLTNQRLTALGGVVRKAGGAQRTQARVDDVDIQLVRMYHRTGSHYLAVLTRAAPKRTAVRLSEMQRRVAGLAAQGNTAQQVSAQLGVSVNTVKFHLKRVYEILNVSNRVELSRALEESVYPFG